MFSLGIDGYAVGCRGISPAAQHLVFPWLIPARCYCIQNLSSVITGKRKSSRIDWGGGGGPE